MTSKATDSLPVGNNRSSKLDSQLAKLKDLFDINERYDNLKQKLQNFDVIIAQMFEAVSCSIVLFKKSELTKLNNYTCSSINNPALKTKGIGVEDHVVEERLLLNKEEESWYKMGVSYDLISRPLLSNGRVIGSVRIHKSKKNRWRPGSYNFELLEIVAYIIAKLIQLNQLNILIKMRNPTLILKQTSNITAPPEKITESPHSMHTAKVFANLVYRDMVNAGFDYKHMIYVASEIISELNDNLREGASKIRNPSCDLPAADTWRAV